MNRIFHARITWYTLFFLAILTLMTVWAWWFKHVFTGIAGTALLILFIERTIHTTYTLTDDGFLLVYKGRFGGAQRIALREIDNVERMRSANFGNFHLLDYITVCYGKGKMVSLIPEKEEEFVRCIKARMQSLKENS